MRSSHCPAVDTATARATLAAAVRSGLVRHEAPGRLRTPPDLIGGVSRREEASCEGCAALPGQVCGSAGGFRFFGSGEGLRPAAQSLGLCQL